MTKTQYLVHSVSRLLTKLISALALIAVTVIACGLLYNMGIYTGRIAAEAEIVLFKAGLEEAVGRGAEFRWNGMRFVPTKSKTAGMRTVLVNSVEVDR